jgi:hypothetical protein
MMDAKMLSLLLQSCVCVVFLTVVLLTLWSSARLDDFRQKMFALRDELFDCAADGNIDFDDPAYRLLRQSMNGTIRYAHQLTFFRVCVTMIEIHLTIHKPKSNWVEDWQLALGKIESVEVRARLESFHSRSTQLIVNRLVLGSPFLFALVMCAIPMFVLRTGWLSLETIAMSTVTRVVNTRMIENEAAAA